VWCRYAKEICRDRWKLVTKDREVERGEDGKVSLRILEMHRILVQPNRKEKVANGYAIGAEVQRP
jgi:hypothetical protein